MQLTYRIEQLAAGELQRPVSFINGIVPGAAFHRTGVAHCTARLLKAA